MSSAEEGVSHIVPLPTRRKLFLGDWDWGAIFQKPRLKGEQHRLRRVDLVMRFIRFVPIPLKFDIEEVLLSQL